MKRLWLPILLVLVALTACAGGPQPDEGIGGTVVQANGLGGTGQKVANGIGGTGQKVADGVGGTGQKVADGIGGTGIVGTVTDFGSIWINHAHVHWDNNTAVRENGRDASTNDFQLGQVVAVLADPVRQGYLARSIDIVYEVVGPIAAIDKQNGKLQVLNQTISTDSDTIVTSHDGAPLKLDALILGNHVQVSGLRKPDGSIVASRIERIPATGEVQLIGELKDQKLSGQPLQLPDDLHVDLEVSRLLVTGHLKNGVLIVDEVTQDAILTVIEQATDLMLEGFLFDQAFDGDIVVGGIEVMWPEGWEPDFDIDFDDPVFIDALLGDDDLFYAEDFLFLPEGADDYFEFDPEDWMFEYEYYEDWAEEVIY